MTRRQSNVARHALALITVPMMIACGPATVLQTATPEAAASPSVSARPSASAVGVAEVRSFPVDADGRQLVMLCEGQGTPTVILEDGHPSETGGVERFSTSAMWPLLTEETRVCAYDRAGYGDSDPAPNEPRDADDVVDDLQALLAAAGEEGPYVLVGSSFGGMIVTYYAARDPDDVVGVLLLDVPAPVDTLTLEEIPELAWDHPANPERVEVIPEFETRFARDPVQMEAPLTVITATLGQSSVEDQASWLGTSPDATQIEVAGEHDIDLSAPDRIATEILTVVAAAR